MPRTVPKMPANAGPTKLTPANSRNKRFREFRIRFMAKSALPKQIGCTEFRQARGINKEAPPQKAAAIKSKRKTVLAYDRFGRRSGRGGCHEDGASRRRVRQQSDHGT